MKQIDNTFSFVVNKRQVSKSNYLKPSVLYKKVEDFANTSMSEKAMLYKINPTSFTWSLLNNALLKDELTVKCYINQFSETVFELFLEVEKKDTKKIICKATFGYAIKKAS